MNLFQNRKLFEPDAKARQLRRTLDSPRTTTRSAASAESAPRLLPNSSIGIEEVHQSLRDLHILLNTRRLYHHTHPKSLESLETCYESLQRAAQILNGLEIRVEREALVVPKLIEAPLPDSKGELQSLAADFQLAGIQTLVLLRQFHVGELDTLTQLLRAALLKSHEPSAAKRSSWWTAKLLEYGVEGILVNAQTDRKVDTVLTSLVAALVAFGGNSAREDVDSPITAPTTENLSAVLTLIARLTPPLESARGLSPEEAARAIHGALAEATQSTVHLLLSTISQHGPQEAEKPQPYLLRLSETIILETLTAEFSGGTLTAQNVSNNIHTLSDVLVSAGAYAGPHASNHLSMFASAWAAETHQEKLTEKFWLELSPREKSGVLRGPDVWCVPVLAIRAALVQLADAGADAPRREARNILLNYARRLEMPDASARRSVATGLKELSSVIESLWPNQLPEELNRCALKALEREPVPEAAALLSAFLEMLGRVAITRGDFAGLEGILAGLERQPREAQFEHMHALAHRLIAQDRFLLLVDAALANRALDPALPRLLVRDPERLLDRLTNLLGETRSSELLPPMARLLRTIGVPVLNLLETRLYEARRQRVSAAIKLLAAADPERLLRALPRALASWEWNLQDLAVSELSRPVNATSARSSAFIFSALLREAHPLVVPMMIDHIGLAQEASAVPQLMEIAGGDHAQLHDQFVRIKAIEALARMRVKEAAGLFRQLCEKREGLAYVEPSGIRTVAADALALLEERPTSPQVRSAYEHVPQAGANFVVPRRYARVPLESPLRAQIAGGQSAMARVKSISLGGAFLESAGKLNVGDTIQLEVRSGLRKIHFTAVVRNAGPDGNGIEIVHMKSDDRDKLRKLVQRHL
jgi:PilZ domain-containing protein